MSINAFYRAQLFLGHIVGVVVAFFYVFNLSFSVLPSFSTGRIAFAYLLFRSWRKVGGHLHVFFHRFFLESMAFVLLICYSFLLFIINDANDGVMLSRVFWFFIYSVIGVYLYVVYCDFNRRAIYYFLGAIVVQVICVVWSVVSPGFRAFSDAVLINSGNIDFSDGVRFSGFSGGGGSTLALVLSLGIFAIASIYSSSINLFLRGCLLLLCLLICLSEVFVGRTGLYISSGLFFVLLLAHRGVVYPLICVIILLVVAVWYMLSGDYFLDIIDGGDIKIDRTIDWAFDIIVAGESSSANALISDLYDLRPITLYEFIFGTGRVVDVDGQNYCRHDAGYIHTFYAVGIFFTLIFYGALLSILIRLVRCLRGRDKLFGYLMIGMVFLLETKEPFIFKYAMTFFVFVFALVGHKNRELINDNNLPHQFP